MTKSSVDRKRSKYGEKYSLRFHKQLKTYDLTCIDETPHLIAKFVETDGDLAMRLFERLESNYKENEQLKQRCKELRNDLIDHSALINMLEKARGVDIEDMIWNTMDYKIQTEFDDDFADYREDAKRRWRE